MNTDKVRELTGILERLAGLHHQYYKVSWEEQEMLAPKINELREYMVKQIERCYGIDAIDYEEEII